MSKANYLRQLRRAFAFGAFTFFVTLSSFAEILSLSASEISQSKTIESLAGLAQIKWGQHRAQDGFVTSYIELTPKNKTPEKTIVLIHGFNKDGLYWIDFIKAARLLEEGYRVLLPDLMFHGRTLELNFPLANNDKHHWVPNSQQKAYLHHATPTKMAFYLYQLLKYKKSSWSKDHSLIIGGHSYGHAVGANLIYMMGKENRSRQMQNKPLAWQVDSHWSFNGFVAYSSDSILEMPFPSTEANAYQNRSQKRALELYQHSVRAQELQEQLALLHDRTLEPSYLQGENQARIQAKLYETHQSLLKEIPTLMQNWVSSFDELKENFFLSLLMQEYAVELESSGGNKDLRWIQRDRMEKVMTAMMQGLRTRYDVQRSDDGRESLMNQKIVIPHSVFGVYLSLALEAFPGLPKTYFVVQGESDLVVPEKLARHLDTIFKLNGSQTELRYLLIKKGSHFGPNEEAVQNLFHEYIKTSSNRCYKVLN